MAQVTSLIYVACDSWDETQPTGALGSLLFVAVKTQQGIPEHMLELNGSWETSNASFFKCLCAEKKAALTL